METYWAHKTNRGKVVYNRKLHVWTDKDVERIVKAFSAETEPEDIPMMSELADRLLFWIARKLSLDDVAGWAAKVVVRLFDLTRGIQVEPMPRGRIARRLRADREIAWLKTLDGLPIADRKEALLQIRMQCASMIQYIDLEVDQDG